MLAPLIGAAEGAIPEAQLLAWSACMDFGPVQAVRHLEEPLFEMHAVLTYGAVDVIFKDIRCSTMDKIIDFKEQLDHSHSKMTDVLTFVKYHMKLIKGFCGPLVQTTQEGTG